jgi:hypothetical protein
MENDWHALTPAKQKEAVESEVEGLLDEIGGRGRDPDPWETQCIGQAIAYVCVGWYSAAAKCVELASTPADQRAPGEPRNPPALTLRDLRDGLAYARGMPARGG